MAFAELSDEGKREALHAALSAKYSTTEEIPVKPGSVLIEEVYDDELIYNIDGQSFKAKYTLGESGELLFGTGEKVIARKTYEPMEALQNIYSDIIQESAKHRELDDKTVLNYITETLALQKPSKTRISEATRAASGLLKTIESTEIVRHEVGSGWPSTAFAYVGDHSDPTTWKLRMVESVASGITKNQLAKVSAYLSPGGYAGKKITLPASALPTVRLRIREAYRAIGTEESEMPKWIKEVETRERVLNFTPLTEAKFEKGQATLIIIKPGFNATGDRYYPAEMLKRDYKVFEGQKMYADHPTDAEDKARPERSIRDWVATLKEVSVADDGTVTGVAEIVESWLMTKLASLRDKNMLGDMGVSINAIGSASKGNIDGKDTLVIERLTGARSVDFVTEPGAGGIVTFYESLDRGQDIDLIEITGLREKRPDLVNQIATEARNEALQEVKLSAELEARITVLEGENETLTKENATLKEKEELAVKEKAKAVTAAAIKEAVEKAELPQAAKDKLLERFKDSDTADGITEAIQAEKDYIAALKESNVVKGLGPSKAVKTDELPFEELKESFKLLGLSDEEAATAALGK